MNQEWKAYLKLMETRPGAFAARDQLSIVTDPAVVQAFVAETGRRLGVVYESPYHLLVVDLLRDENGTLLAYERLLPAVETGAVVTVPVQDGRFLLLRQYRHALRDDQYAFPRGFGEPGIAPEDNAAKELAEELGARTLDSRFLGTVTADSGISGARAAVFLCRVEGASLQAGHEGIEALTALTAGELTQWIAQGKITDGFTLAAWSLYQAQTCQ